MGCEYTTLYAVTLINKNTKQVCWPCMAVMLPDGIYARTDTCDVNSDNYVYALRDQGRAGMLYRLDDKYEVIKKVEVENVEIERW